MDAVARFSKEIEDVVVHMMESGDAGELRGKLGTGVR